MFFVFYLWSWMEMKLEITFALTMSTNLRKNLYAVTSMELFKLVQVYVLFSVLQPTKYNL